MKILKLTNVSFVVNNTKQEVTEIYNVCRRVVKYALCLPALFRHVFLCLIVCSDRGKEVGIVLNEIFIINYSSVVSISKTSKRS